MKRKLIRAPPFYFTTRLIIKFLSSKQLFVVWSTHLNCTWWTCQVKQSKKSFYEERNKNVKGILLIAPHYTTVKCTYPVDYSTRRYYFRTSLANELQLRSLGELWRDCCLHFVSCCTRKPLINPDINCDKKLQIASSWVCNLRFVIWLRNFNCDFLLVIRVERYVVLSRFGHLCYVIRLTLDLWHCRK